ncbi:hypothetical protein [Gracilimonas sediminicola]|uniref:Lipoprotein n=1 Tax=Gracilimonas sediminicola TaxID=2952158 RepID=A0A9X2RGW9_9BACT|nr:hypothetical protein [Gracilimonas sediminicola]MCP9291269.1 hypothetical protein [Gracilimonas sediminicola]
MKNTIPIFVALVSVLSLFSCSNKEQEKEASVMKEVKPNQSEPSDTVSAEKYYLEADIEALSVLKKGDTFEVKTKEGQMALTLDVRRVQETIPGITSISANIGNKEKGLATLLLRDGRLTGMLDLYQENKKYRVQYDTERNASYIQEILPGEMDVLEGGKPLNPGESTRQQ